MLNIRSASADEHEVLSDLAAKAEGYWGYDEEYMEKFKSTYRLTEKFISSYPTYVLERGGEIIGFYSIEIREVETSLEYFFIKPEFIGSGYGRLLWNHLILRCKELGIKEFSIVTSPHAKEFYIKMGAILIGEVESLLIKGRRIPSFVYRLTDE
ncbi:MAG: GNAT family N-acetyltransferase [Bacillota bacterium]|nr:GNAT family N-acetyltransferase [Bacillota bacterium]